MRVLLVEDDRAVMMVTTKYIESFGHEVVPAMDAETALEIFNKDEMDLVFMDYVLPGMNGIEATKELRKRFPDDWFPIIFLTSANDEKNLADGLGAGGDDYLHKPVTPIVLEAKIKAMERIVSMQKQLLAANQQMEQLSFMDGLTHILNRRGFDKAITKEWCRMTRESTELCLLLIDVDQFKLYNDNYGHQAGDECLRTVACALEEQIYRPGDLVARYGGEEFVVLLANTDLQGAEIVADRLNHSIESLALTHEFSSVASHVTISSGLASSKLKSVESIEQLIKKADEALYEAKEQGRNRYIIAS